VSVALRDRPTSNEWRKHMNVSIYLRMASVGQGENDALVCQKDLAERYCSRRGFTIVGLYCDSGVSGLLPLDRRPAGSRLLSDAHSAKFDRLLVSRLDRLSRDTTLMLSIVAELERCGVRVLSMTENFNRAIARLMVGPHWTLER